MKSLRKEKGGYALLYVLVIVMVLVAISMMICTVALRNLQSQQAAVERMANKYAAQGEIEKIKAEIEKLSLSGTGDRSAAISAYKEKLNEFREENAIKVDIPADFLSDADDSITISVKSGTTTVTAELNVNLTITTESAQEEQGETSATEESYIVTTKSVTFAFYTIETTGGDAG